MDVFISKVTSRGQVTIPQELREEEGITSDDYVAIRRVGNYIVLGKAELRLDEITGAFEKEAKTKGISKNDLLEELENVRKSKK
ncbi:AbrB/MazE/SpoVT family DNA-binding domain-containing protein [Candidatus Micrarchaeota archaeon]|nr:AbrB/MazE/SpoVT family DNA-binding domain-containing protein [Candidatus Micrarchaeota archaeon]MBI5176523.1 AbrB/MazE/SpoVT family DNA-binding domain-containing protein [Candidatus Micrarchaeota archaeon]